MTYHQHTFAFGEQPKTVDEMVTWLREGRAEIHVYYDTTWLSWGLGSDHNRSLGKREYTQLQRRVTLVESRTSKHEARGRYSPVREYAAAGQQTWKDVHGWYNDR